MLFTLAILVVFLLLVALYESWAIPASVMLIVPIGALGSVLAVTALGMSNDVYFKVGLVTIIGLAAKNAILIVEFAKSLHEQGRSLAEAAIEAARLRFRPILMTSLAFTLGVVPLALATGAGAASQHAIGIAVIGGMVMATLGVVFVPVFSSGSCRCSAAARRPAKNSTSPAIARRRRGMKQRKSLVARSTTAALLTLALAGCTLAPTYERPPAPIPSHWQGAGTAPVNTQVAAAELDWNAFVTDDHLRRLIELALDNNRDLRQSLLNVEAARAQYRVQRADRLPSVGVQGGGTRQRCRPT